MKWDSILYDNTHDFVSKYGEGVLSYMQTNADEIILDLGCGTGDLTNKIFLSGAKVIGIDASAEMIDQARAKFPAIEFHRMDATALQFDVKFDTIFSNAVLHWIPEKEKVIESMFMHLKPKGRVVLEFGGKGNVLQMRRALKDILKKREVEENVRNWYFPSIAEYATELEKKGFSVIHAEHFDRPTPLKGKNGLKDWFLMFAEQILEKFSEKEKREILDEVQKNLKNTHLKDGVWVADYKRIRIVAIKE